MLNIEQYNEENYNMFCEKCNGLLIESITQCISCINICQDCCTYMENNPNSTIGLKYIPIIGHDNVTGQEIINVLNMIVIYNRDLEGNEYVGHIIDYYDDDDDDDDDNFIFEDYNENDEGYESM